MTPRTKQKSAGAAAPKKGFSLISDEKLLAMYSTMLKCRMVEERTRALLEQNGFAPDHNSAVGEEAALVGALIDLQPQDAIGPSPRDLVANFIGGAPLDKMLGNLPVRKGRRKNGRAGTDLSPALAAQLEVVTGVALAYKKKKNGKVAVALCGDGSSAPEAWNGALKLAGLKDLPVIFLFQGSICSAPTKNQPEAVDILASAEACGFPGIAVDASDVVAVYRVACEAIAKARAGSGPTLIECRAYPGAGGKVPDPILKMQRYLAGKGLETKQLKREIGAQFPGQIDAAVHAAQASPRSKTEMPAVSCTVRERIENPTIWTPGR